MMGSGALLQRIRHFPSRLLPKDKSDVNIISCVSFPFKQYRTKKKGWFKQGKGSRANPQKRLLYHASGTAATQKPEQRIIKPKRETIDFAASVSYNISDPKK